MKRATIFRRMTVLTLLAFAGCGSEPAGTPITVSGTLDDGLRAPLAGYKMQCVIPAVPTSSAVATADADGKFSLNFAAGALPFGCFVLNASDVRVAALFANTTAMGQTILMSGSLDLGKVTVDAAHGVATPATVPTVGTTITGTTCPAGLYKGTVGVNGNAGCGGDTVNSAIWVGKDAAGTFVVSQAFTPWEATTCGLSSFGATAGSVTYTPDSIEGSLVWTMNTGHATSVDAAVSADCNTLNVAYEMTGCGVCGAAGDLATLCTGTGVLTCTSNGFVFLRQ